MATEESTKLNEMLRNIPDDSDNLANNIFQLEDIREELTEQVNAVEIGLLDVAANRLKSFLEGKALALENAYTYRGMWELGTVYNTGDTIVIAPDTPIDETATTSIHYQAIADGTAVITNFPVDGIDSTAYWVLIPYVVEMYRAKLKPGYNVAALTDWSVQEATIIPPPPPPPILPPTYVWDDVYSLTVNWDSNVQVIKIIADWDYGYDLLNKALSATGTYGLYAQIANIDVAITLVTANKAKLDAGTNVYSDYIPQTDFN
jgi:hypothetical protein